MKWIRQVYDWVLAWANSPYGVHALFLLAFVEAVFFPVPPDVLLIALVLGSTRKAFWFAGVTTAGSVLGAMVGYAIGYYIWEKPSGEFTGFALFFFDHVPGFTVELFERISALFSKYNFWVIFVAGFTPIPYKVFTVTGGVFQVHFTWFVLASVVSRASRFFFIAALIWKFGPGIKAFIDKYFNILAVLFTLLLIGGFLMVKYFIK
jgi:membrane protein YqaA with SNARE-associated domain